MTVAAVSAFMGAGTSSATETTGTRSPGSSQPEFCATLVGAATASDISPTLAEACSETSRADAVDKMRAEASHRGITAVADTPLMIWYEHADYKGFSNVIYGNAGRCDRSGYKINPNSYWAGNLSSIGRVDTCDKAFVYNTRIDFTETYTLSVPLLGAGLNDNVGRVKVFSSYWP
ncbi:hypothetical protein ALI144C_29760 [Actinosynnema sp. ALI-1.44]|nr:hypothetical protein ALI144C_29760 [Actinosynnema sp. ALI-1.44]